MALTVPTIPQMPAGTIATSAQMNQLAAACTFLLGKPLARVHDGAGAQAIGTSMTLISFNTADVNTDGMWVTGTNNRLTAQTPGWYKVRYSVVVPATGVSNGNAVNAEVIETTGSNNPRGSGLAIGPFYAGYTRDFGAASNPIGAGASGVWPVYLYAGDFLQVKAMSNVTGFSTAAGESFFGLEYVST